MFGSKRETIPEFYKDKNIFLTGCTGYIGIVVIEKLLRSCPDIKNIYVLIREKKSMTIEERIDKWKNDAVFRVLKETNPNALYKIVPIAGDTTKLGLGISEEDRKTLIKKVTIVFHLAASVRFDDFLHTAIKSNVKSTREVIELVSQLTSVDAFVYAGTAFSNCERKLIEEKFYPAKYDWRDAIELAECHEMKDITDQMTLKFIEPMQNTYVFTKGVAEHVVKDLCNRRFPTCIIRPSMVAPSIQEPFEGYVNNLNGTLSLFLASGLGIAKVVQSSPDLGGDHVYVDNVAKAIIIASWQTAKQKPLEEIKIYNITTDWIFNATESAQAARDTMHVNPLKYYLGPANTVTMSCDYGYYVYNILFHLIPALFIDLIFRLLGKKIRILPLRRKLVKANTALLPFIRPLGNEPWKFVHENYLGLEECLKETDKHAFSFLHTRSKEEEYSEKTRKNFAMFISKSRVLVIPGERETASEAEILRYKRVVLADKIIKNTLWTILLCVACWKYNLHWIIINKIVKYIEFYNI